MNDPLPPEPDPRKVAFDLVPLDPSDRDTGIHIRTLIAKAIREERARQRQIMAVYVRQIADAVGPYTPARLAPPTFRPLHDEQLSAPFTLDRPPHTHAPDTGQWAGCRACSLNLPEGA